MACSATDPCPIYLDLAHVYALGQRLVATGNIHSAESTLYSILLLSEDSGVTWKEPHPRARGGELDQIQFLSLEKGWVSGQRVLPLAGDPFLLITADGGRTWRKSDVLGEGGIGFVQKFWFSSALSGELVIDRGASDGEQGRFARYESMTGGLSWQIRESSPKAITIGPKVQDETWRVRADAKAKTLSIEKNTGAGWVAVGTLALELAVCKGEEAK